MPVFAGALQNVLEVVDDLVAKAPADGDTLEQLDFASGRAAEHGRDDQCKADKGNSFATGDALSGFAGVGQSGIVEVEALAVEQAFDAEALLNVGQRRGAGPHWGKQRRRAR